MLMTDRKETSLSEVSDWTSLFMLCAVKLYVRLWLAEWWLSTHMLCLFFCLCKVGCSPPLWACLGPFSPGPYTLVFNIRAIKASPKGLFAYLPWSRVEHVGWLSKEQTRKTLGSPSWAAAVTVRRTWKIPDSQKELGALDPKLYTVRLGDNWRTPESSWGQKSWEAKTAAPKGSRDKE